MLALFPDEAPDGRIASPLLPLSLGLGLGGAARAFLKADNQLPVCASVKARGGLYEVFCRAEEVATGHGLLKPEDDYRKLASPPLRAVLGEEEVAVGSTGNLGMSVGLAAAALGMRATVHMSTDAKEWKKQLLRDRGVTVVEHSGQYCEAVAEGRQLAQRSPRCHFSKQSQTLLLGYSAAAAELRGQLLEAGAEVSAERPLVVYVPCGVGGAPAGICWGLKHEFGDAVHVFFAEPTRAPCVTLPPKPSASPLACTTARACRTSASTASPRRTGWRSAVRRGSRAAWPRAWSPAPSPWTTRSSSPWPRCGTRTASSARGRAGGIRPAARSGRTRPHAALLAGGTHVFWATGGALVARGGARRPLRPGPARRRGGAPLSAACRRAVAKRPGSPTYRPATTGGAVVLTPLGDPSISTPLSRDRRGDGLPQFEHIPIPKFGITSPRCRS
ncbi:unnamed protein product [Prorocentrum cordatum]|uniref:Tryptophan synthase beta chain-like PALP domain-containing protein n=1 Tax=Prorocentrum cordatum TaxID=2364126 RepID=A0ABN9VG33_9DINO|nr:unnamed protein product [Polarella glacialis]